VVGGAVERAVAPIQARLGALEETRLPSAGRGGPLAELERARPLTVRGPDEPERQDSRVQLPGTLGLGGIMGALPSAAELGIDMEQWRRVSEILGPGVGRLGPERRGEGQKEPASLEARVALHSAAGAGERHGAAETLRMAAAVEADERARAARAVGGERELPGAGGSTDPLMILAANAQTQTAMFRRILERPPPGLEGILESGRSLREDDVGSVRGASARDVFTNMFRTREGCLIFIRSIRTRLKRAMPGKARALMREYFMERSPLGRMRLLTYAGCLLGEIWDIGEEQEGIDTDEDPPGSGSLLPMIRQHALVGHGCIFSDQVATEGGTNYTLGWLLTGMEIPPFDSISSRGGPAQRQELEQFSSLVDPRYIAANIAWVRDLDMLAERGARVAARAAPGTHGAATPAANPSAAAAAAAAASGAAPGGAPPGGRGRRRK
jgi:hypothetical protein